MKTLLICSLGMLASAAAQQVPVGEPLGDSNVSVVSKVPPKPETITLITKKRKWTSSDGKVIEAELIATPVGQGKERKLHVILLDEKDEKVRLFMNGKVFTLSMSKLAKADQEFLRLMDKTGKAPPLGEAGAPVDAPAKPASPTK